MSAHLRAVPDDPDTVDPVQEIEEAVAMMDRLRSNPLLATPAQAQAIDIMGGFLTRSLKQPVRRSR